MTQLRVLFALTVLVSGAFLSATAPAEAALTDDRFVLETVAGEFQTPTVFAFIDQNRLLVGQKNGVIYLVENGVRRPEPVYEIQNINTFWDRGLLGMAVDSRFAQNGYIYVSYTHENNPDPAAFEAPKTARIVRLTVNRTTWKASNPVILVGTVAGTPDKPSCSDYAIGSDCMPSDSPSHSAGGLRFGPDGFLYATVGDGAGFTDVDPKAYNAQNLDSLSGKVLRINRNGVAPTSNPFYTGNGQNNRSKIFAYGLRNSYRFNFQPGTNRLYAGEVGWYIAEEINLIERGNNLAWPCREGMAQHPLYQCTAPNYVDPIYVYGHETPGTSNSIAGGAFATSSVYGDFQGSYFFGDYSQDFMKRAVINGRSIEVFDFGTDVGGPVDIQTGPDGLIYYISIYTGEVRRINVRSDNTAPTAVMTVGQAIGDAPVTVSFSGLGSTDPDADPLTYTWSFGDGNTGSGATTSHTYEANGVYTATLTVSDGQGGTANTSRTVTVGGGTFTMAPSHVSSSHSPSPLFLGQPVTLISTLTNAGTAGNLIAYWEVYNAAGTRVSFHTTPMSMTAGETAGVSFTTLPPVPGVYTVALGLFSDDWRQTYQWVPVAHTYEVQNRVIGLPELQFVTAVGSDSGSVGTPHSFTINARNNGTAGDGIVYVEFYTPSGVRESYQVFTSSFGASETKAFPVTWTPRGSGTYRIDVGLMSTDWSRTYEWRSSALLVGVGSSAPTVTSLQIGGVTSATTGTVGTAQPLAIDVTNIGATGDGIVYVEFYGPSGARESFQYAAATFDSGATVNVPFTWTPTVAGAYRVAVGLFNPSWAQTYEWRDVAATVTAN
jgi:glucose/arabinose dehydrogenase/PKD repeat protein